jgi:hypothetical protein
MPRNEGESKEDCARRLKRNYDNHIDMLWDDYVGELSAFYGITEEEAEKLLNEAM